MKLLELRMIYLSIKLFCSQNQSVYLVFYLFVCWCMCLHVDTTCVCDGGGQKKGHQIPYDWSYRQW